MAIILKVTDLDNNQRLERWLRKKYPHLSYGLLQKCLRTGQVRVNSKRVKGEYLLQESDQVRLPPFLQGAKDLGRTTSVPRGNEKTYRILKTSIVFEDEYCLILQKPAGLAVQGGTNQRDYVALYLDRLVPQEEPLYIVHRLDKDTTGLLILAKTRESAQYFSQLFKNHNIQKTYHAVVVGKPPKKQGEINLALGKLVGNKKEKMSTKADKAVEALTFYQLLAYDKQNNISLVTLHPKTGRTHQLRVHMAEGVGCPIVGDGKYGGDLAHPFQKRTSLQLAATGLDFENPKGEKITLRISLPSFFSITI